MNKLLIGLMLVCMSISDTAWAAGSDELWEITNKMEMEGMPFAMPGQTNKVCMQKGKQNDPAQALPKDKEQDCKMSDVKMSGNKSSWKMSCSGKHPMTGVGEMTSSSGSYSGKVKMHSADGDMNMSYEGKRIGSCDYAKDGPEAKFTAMKNDMDAKSEQERVKECKDAVDDNSYNKFLKPDCSWAKDPNSKKICANMGCRDSRPKMCERIAKKLSEGDNGYEEIANNKDARQLAKECGQNYEKSTRAYCQRQLQAKDYSKLAAHCDKEAKPLFDKQCAGRDYTAAMDSAYGPICRRYGKWKNAPADEGEQSEKSSSSTGSNPAKSILDGAKSLKGLFGF